MGPRTESAVKVGSSDACASALLPVRGHVRALATKVLIDHTSALHLFGVRPKPVVDADDARYGTGDVAEPIYQS